MEIQRNRYLNQLITRRDNGLVKVITGLRRCGKTYLLHHLYHQWLLEQGVPDDHILYIALDRNENARYRNPILLDQYLRERIRSISGRCYVMIDEIQYAVPVPNEALPESVRTADNAITFYDTVLGLMEECDLYITGSNSQMLSSDILTNFRGRGDEVRVYPLSYAEFRSAYSGDTRYAFREYLYHGGMPMILSIPDEAGKGQYLRNLFTKTYEDDIINRYHIKNRDDLGSVLDFLASATGSLVNATAIADHFKEKGISEMARNTVDEYISHIEQSFLVQEARRFDLRGKEYVSGQQKYYFTDLGLRNARLNFRQFDRPHLLENVVYNELVMHGYSVDVGRVQTRIKNKSGNWQISYLESDFVVHDLSRKMYIQVAEGIDDPDKKRQEMASLLHIRDGFPKYILIDQDVPMHYTEEGIAIMSVQDFLLQDAV